MGAVFSWGGQGGLKEAIKGPCNGISNVSLPLQNGGKKHLPCIFHSPAPHLSFKLSGRAPRLRGARIFFPGLEVLFRRLGGSEGRRDGRRVARSLVSGRSVHVSKQRLARWGALVGARSSSVTGKKKDSEGKRTSHPPLPLPLRASASEKTCSVSTFFSGLLFIFLSPPRRPFAKRGFSLY